MLVAPILEKIPIFFEQGIFSLKAIFGIAALTTSAQGRLWDVLQGPVRNYQDVSEKYKHSKLCSSMISALDGIRSIWSAMAY